MNKIKLILTVVLFAIIPSCSDTKETSQSAGSLGESTANELTLSKVLIGQWKAEEAEGIPPHWREFDPSDNSFRSWNLNGPKLSAPDGFYEIIGDTTLQLTFVDSEASYKYGLDSLSVDYLEMWYHGVSASNLIYQRADYEENHLEDISKDTVTVEGKIIEAIDIGWAYTYGLHIDIGSDTILTNYFTQEFSENTLRNKQVKLSYTNNIEYGYPNANNQSQVFEITGIYKILDYGGDLPGSYSITDKNGKSIVFDSFFTEEHSKHVGTEVSELYIERYTTNIVSLEVKQPIMNTLVFGDWHMVTSDTMPVGYQQIKIRPGGEKGVYIDFGGQGDNYVKSDIYSNTIEGRNASGKFKLELIPGDPIQLDYSDDGNGGHYNPIINQKYQLPESDFRQLLIGKWQGIKDTEGSVEFTDKEEIDLNNNIKNPYVLSNIIMNTDTQEVFNGLFTNEDFFISTLYQGEGDLVYHISKLNGDSLSYGYMGTANTFHFVRMK